MRQRNGFSKIQNRLIQVAHSDDLGALYQSLSVLQFLAFYLSLIDQRS